jgi:hypothetical protein
MTNEKRLQLLNYIEYLTIVKDYTENNFDTNIVINNLTFLQNLSETDNAYGTIGAQIILEQYAPENYDYPEKIEYPDASSTKSMQIGQSKDIYINNEILNEFINIYPNPANDNLIVEYALLEGWNNGKIEIYDLQGKLIKSVSINKQTGIKTINLSDIASGNYLITVGNKGINGYMKQITIKH